MEKKDFAVFEQPLIRMGMWITTFARVHLSFFFLLLTLQVYIFNQI